MRTYLLGAAIGALATLSLAQAEGKEPSPDVTPTDENPVMSLAGSWQLRLDPTSNEGVRGRWYASLLGGEAATLPGTLHTNNARTKPARKPDSPDQSTLGLGGFTTLYGYRGAAWYQREIEIPASWTGKQIELFMESVMWESYVWVDEQFQGTRNSLVSPHTYDLSKALTPGKHRITLAIDNSNSPKAMSGIADATTATMLDESKVAGQMMEWFNEGAIDGKRPEVKYNAAGHQVWATIWNGIQGDFQLRARAPLHVASVQAYPQIKQEAVRLKLELANSERYKGPATLEMECRPRAAAHPVTKATWKVELSGEPKQSMEQVLSLNKPVLLWDEHSPNLYDLSISLSPAKGAKGDVHHISFGMRELGRTASNQFTVNGRVVFMRGNMENFIFPLTANTPVDLPTWRRVMALMKLYGLNCLRFHTCAPPDAAYEAADEAGIFLMVETLMHEVKLPPNVLDVREPVTQGFIQNELQRILENYGNHPSLFSVSMGNEHFNRQQGFRAALVRFAQRLDPRHFYSETSGGETRTPRDSKTNGAASDFFISAHPITGKEPLTGIQWGGNKVIDCSRFNTRPPETLFDYSASLAGLDKPLISHEVGQWAVYPDLREISRYHGAQRAFNFEIIRDRLTRLGQLEFANDFTRASGMLARVLYKEEIESALRTPGMAGFHLLQLHDYPGQGTSTVGLLNALWESKGLITPAEFRAFCGPVVPLARLPKRVWSTDQTINTRIDLCNYGATDVAGPARWSLSGQDGRLYASGELSGFVAKPGGLTTLGTLSIPLDKIVAPAKVILRVSVNDMTPNQWDLWVYPAQVLSEPPPGVTLATQWDDAARQRLRDGGAVLLVVDGKKVKEPIAGTFTPVFWNAIMKYHQVSKTMGLFCDPGHPALAGFPTDFHSNWQWWDPVMKSVAMRIDGLNPAIRPIVRVVDSFVDNKRLAMVFEAKVGQGRLIVCSTDIINDLENRPAARQLRRSLFDYMASAAFSPDVPVSEQELDALFPSQ